MELGTEELPPLALPELERAFADGIRAGLTEASLPFGELRSFATPRRLAVLVRDLAALQPAQSVKLKGPPVNAAFGKDGAPTAAATRFAEKCGVDVASLSRVTEGKGEFLYYSGAKPGLSTVALLPGIVQKSLDALPIPKRMRWGASTAEFVRPVHWLTMLFGGLASSCLGLFMGVRRMRRAGPRVVRSLADAPVTSHPQSALSATNLKPSGRT